MSRWVMKQAERTGVEPVSDIEFTSAPYLIIESHNNGNKREAWHGNNGKASLYLLDENVDNPVLAGDTSAPERRHIVNRPSNINWISQNINEWQNIELLGHNILTCRPELHTSLAVQDQHCRGSWDTQRSQHCPSCKRWTEESNPPWFSRLCLACPQVLCVPICTYV